MSVNELLERILALETRLAVTEARLALAEAEGRIAALEARGLFPVQTAEIKPAPHWGGMPTTISSQS